jgi:glycosyltransferase involved in cell wall biosynthesis
MTFFYKKNRVVIFESTRPDNPTMGGSYISLRVIVNGLAEAGWDVIIVSYVKNPLIQFPHLDCVRNHIIPHYSLRRLLGKKASHVANSQKKSAKGKSKNKLMNAFRGYTSTFFVHFFLIFNTFTVTKEISKLNPDLVYSNTGLANDRAVILASVILRKKMFCHLRNLSKLGFIDRYLSQKISGAIFISRTVKNYYLSNNIFFQNQRVIHNALGSNFEEQDYVQGSNILETGEKYQIASFMRLIPWKGALTLLRAFSEFRQKGGRGMLSIYGDGQLKSSLIDEVMALEIEKYVIFHGHINDIVNEMKKSSLIIAPSDKPEPLGRTVMEAKRLGIPVIASNAGGFLETINHGHDGMLFDIGSVESLSERMLDVYRNKELRVNLSIKGLKQSKAWSSDEYCKKLLEFVNEVCF